MTLNKFRPGAEPDPYEVWLLSGLRIGINYDVEVAGVPLTAGVRCPTETIPTQDAVVVDRPLDAVARMIAKITQGAVDGAAVVVKGERLSARNMGMPR